jgi:hypothetical protein
VERRVPDAPLDISNHLAGVGLKPASVKVLGHHPELHYEIARKILRLDLAPLFAPEAKERVLVVAHDDPRVGAADKTTRDKSRFFTFLSICLSARASRTMLVWFNCNRTHVRIQNKQLIRDCN